MQAQDLSMGLQVTTTISRQVFFQVFWHRTTVDEVNALYTIRGTSVKAETVDRQLGRSFRVFQKHKCAVDVHAQKTRILKLLVCRSGCRDNIR